jgi:hypothetical protein
LTSGSGNSSSNSSYSKNNFEIQNLSTEINNQENRNDISNKFSNSNNGNVSNAPLFGHLRASAGAGLAIALAPSVNLEVTYYYKTISTRSGTLYRLMYEFVYE